MSSFCPQPPALVILPSSPCVFLLSTAPCTGHPSLISLCLPSVHSPLHWSSFPHLLVSSFCPQPPALVILPSSPCVFLLSTAPCTGHPSLISLCLPSVHSPLYWSSSPHLLVSSFCPLTPVLVILPSSPCVFLLSTAPCTGHPPLISLCLPSVHSPLHWSSFPHLLVSSFCPQPPALVILPSSPCVFLLSTAPCTGHPRCVLCPSCCSLSALSASLLPCFHLIVLNYIFSFSRVGAALSSGGCFGQVSR